MSESSSSSLPSLDPFLVRLHARLERARAGDPPSEQNSFDPLLDLLLPFPSLYSAAWLALDSALSSSSTPLPARLVLFELVHTLVQQTVAQGEKSFATLVEPHCNSSTYSRERTQEE